MPATFHSAGAAYGRKKRRWVLRMPRHHADNGGERAARAVEPLRDDRGDRGRKGNAEDCENAAREQQQPQDGAR